MKNIYSVFLLYTFVTSLVLGASATATVRTHTSTYRNQTTYDSLPVDFLKGRVQDINGNLLAGVSIGIRGTKAGTVTDNQGNFYFKHIKSSAILVFSYVGFKQQILNVPTSRMMVVLMEQSDNQLDEAVVLAYGATTRRFSTSNIGTVKAADIAVQPVTNPLLALQGRVPGVVISPSTGMNNAGVKVTIQGSTSLAPTIGNDPLYVIDGVPYTSQLMTNNQGGFLGASGTLTTQGTNGSPMSFINPSDIERIDILKDADATAIYGSRAANGAILITTKKGRGGKMSIDINANSGFSKLIKFADLLNTPEYITIRKEAFANFGLTPSAQPNSPTYAADLMLWDTVRYTDWQKELLGKSIPFSNIEAAVTGGGNNIYYRISGTYSSRGTMFPSAYGFDHDRRGAMNANLSANSPNNRLKMEFIVRYLYDVNKMPNLDPTTIAYRLSPNAPALYNSDGSLNWAPDINGNSSWTNPLSYEYSGYANRTGNLGTSLNLNYSLLNGVQFKTLLGYNNIQTDDYSFTSKSSFAPERRATQNSSANKGTFNINNWVIEPQVSYVKDLGHGKLDFLVGMSIQQENRKGLGLSASNFASDLSIFDIKQASNPIVVGINDIIEYKYNALFSRLNYNFLEKYIINLAFRRDGSSRFGVENRFHNFWSIGGAWIISQENWFKSAGNLINYLKLRSSYGLTGNDQIGDYTFYNLYNVQSAPNPYQGIISISTSGLPNPYLQWEETKKFDVGLEVSMLKNRIMANLGYIKNRSGNQIVQYVLPSTTGATSILKNFPGLIQNTAFEATLSTNNIRKKDFSWVSSINITIPRNKLIKFDNLKSSSYANKYKIGEPITVAKLFRYAGVNTETGLYEFYAADGTRTSAPKTNIDDEIYQNIAPTLMGGIQNTLNLKGFQLDFFFQYTEQVKMDQARVGGGALPGSMSNVLQMIMDRWQKKGDITDVQKVASSGQLLTQILAATNSDLVYTDASFLRLKNVNISYSLPTELINRINIKQARVYVQAQNIWTWSGFKGLDPDLGNGGLSMPSLFTIVGGVNLSF
ncbi:TonB-linked outer membrane protein, SusC/RagA family [Chitinophaga jiangningensis]|uniref:TonB-linked outer membrane protein, SusC/RagA family n=1 Tax=Chitinophaga jiangningensis TaxID=1419482 RepID=A0A1M7BVR0_9BACT|nr:SusC/RagA family TonB-linked outer membrane protein [Chitinophaga jiangningensis]SHL58659.1 TonB-linked outer membrane protein, SusC/RagA family [Chitinophaga jiangningensis]